jgi:ankyrin repeat protein
MEYLFDPNRPHFAAWLQIHNIDTEPKPDLSESALYMFTYNHNLKPSTLASPLYYAALHGFQDLVQYLVDITPRSVNELGGFWMTPLVAALAQGHLRIAEYLKDQGAHVNVRGYDEETPLHSVASHGNLKLARELVLNHEADINARSVNNWTPLHHVCQGFRHPLAESNKIPRPFPGVAQLLLKSGADVDARTDSGLTPLPEQR